MVARKIMNNIGYTFGGYDKAGVNYYHSYSIERGYDNASTKKGVDYIIEQLNRGIPLLVAVQAKINPKKQKDNTDKTTTHANIIIGYGEDKIGTFFRFLNTGRGTWKEATNEENRYYFDNEYGLYLYSNPVHRVTNIRITYKLK